MAQRANPDGTATHTLHAGPVRVRKEGQWVAVDTSLVIDPLRGQAVPSAAVADVAFSAGGTSPLLQLASGDTQISMQWPLPLPVPVLQGSAARYPGAAGGLSAPVADLELRAAPMGAEVSMSLRTRPLPGSAPTWTLPVAAPGLTAVQVDDGIELRDPNGVVRLLISQTDTFDSSADPVTGEPMHRPVTRTQLVSTSTGIALRIAPDPGFLADPALIYPVTVDPVLLVPSGASDTYVDQAFPTATYSGSTELHMGRYNTGSGLKRTFATFDTSSIAGKSVVSANLNLNTFHSWSCTPKPVRIRSAFGSSAATNWNNQPGVDTSDYGVADVSFARGYSSACPAGVQTLPITGIAQNWASNSVSTGGVRLAAADESDVYGYKKFYSSEQAGSVPQIDVTVADDNPIGSLDSVSRVPTGLRVSGWTLDPNTTGPIHAHVYIDGSGVADVLANGSRPDVGAAYPGYGSNHGFDVVVSADALPEGDHQVCVYGINQGAGTTNSLLGCRTVQVSHTPFGDLNTLTRTGYNTAEVVGWAIDPDTASALTMQVNASAGMVGSDVADLPREDVANAYPPYGSARGFDITVTVGPSAQQVCVNALNQGPGTSNPAVGCKSLPAAVRPPVPTAPTVSSSTHPDASTWYRTTSVSLAWSATSAEVDGYSYVLDTNSSTVPDTVSEGSTTSRQYNGLSDGDRWFHIRARNAAGDWGATTHRQLRSDSTPPTLPGSVQSSTHTPGQTSSGRSIVVTWGASSDAASGVASYRYAFTQSPTPPAASSVSDSTTGTSAQSGLLGDGPWYFHVYAEDMAGNKSAFRSTTTPFLIGESTLAGGLLPSDPVAQSDELGLEQFYAYDDVNLGPGTAYVNIRTGNLASQYELASVPGQGLNTVVRLTHNSQAAGRDSGIGRGWSLSVSDAEAGLDGVLEDVSDNAVTDIDVNRDITLGKINNVGEIVQDVVYTGSKLAGDVLEFVDGDGTTHRFVRETKNGRWISPPGVDLKVKETLNAADQATKYEFYRPDGVVYTAEPMPVGVAGTTFASLTLPIWRITSVRDRNGNQLTYTHENFDGAGINKTRLTKIVQNRYPTRPVATFTYEPYVAGSLNTDAGVLRSITTLPGVTAGGRSYERRTDLTITSGDHRLTGWTENAHTATQGGSAVSTAEQARRSFAFTYNTDDTLATASDGVSTSRQTRFSYTAGRPAGTPATDPTIPQLTSITDRNNATWRWTYTPNTTDNTTTTTATIPVTSTSTTSRTYTLSARTRINTTDDKRNTGGNLTSIRDAGDNNPSTSNVTTYSWYANKLVTVTDGEGAQTSYTYNDLGLLTSTTTPEPNRSDLGSATGAPTSRIRNTLTYRTAGSYPNCTQPADNSRPVSNAAACDLYADLTRIVAADSTSDQRVADFDPDPATGQLRSFTERANSDGSASSADRTTAFTYYTRGGLKTIDGPRADVTDVTTYGTTTDTAYGGYDRTGQPLTIRDAAGKTKTFTYSPYGTVLSQTDRDGRTTSSRYDERDNLISATAPGGAVTDYTYDGNDNKTSEQQPTRTRSGTTYRPTTSYSYDPVDRLTRTDAPGEDERPGSTTGKTTSLTGYNLDGTLAYTDGPLAGTADRTTYTYWPNRRVKTVTEPAATGQNAVTDYEYDKAGRTTKTTRPAANAAGQRPIEITLYTPSGDVAQTRTTASTGADGNTDRTVTLFHNAHGDVLVTTGPRSVNGQTTREENTYDRFGQQTSTRRLAGKTSAGADRWITSETGYDTAGNQTRSTQATGNGAQLESLYRYDALNRLAEQTQDPVNPGHTVTYLYNGEGQQTQRQDKNGNTVLRTVDTEFNNDNTKRREAVTTGDTTTPANRRVLLTCNYRPDGSSGYDTDGNLLHTRTVQADPASAGDPCLTGTATREQETTFDDRDWPTQVVTKQTPPGAATPLTRTQRITYHANGSKASLTHNDGTTDYTATYAISPAGWDEKVTDWRGRDTTSSYLPSGDITSTTMGATAANPNGAAKSASTYHRDGTLASLTWTAGGVTVRQHNGIGYDVGGIRTQEFVSVRQPGAAANVGATASYSYDLLDRLTSYTSPFAFDDTETRKPTTAYTLDDGGNVTREVTTVPASGLTPARTMVDTTSTYTTGRLTGQVTKTASSDLASTLGLTTTDTSFTYNGLGEETARSSTDNYASTIPIGSTTSSTATTFDASGHPLAVTNTATRPSGTPAEDLAKANADVDYVYDSADRVLSRVEHQDGKPDQVTLFWYAAGSGQLIEETDAAGKTKTRYLLDGEGEAIGQQTYTVNADGTSAAPAGDKFSWLLNDALGNTATVVDDTGAVVEQKAFDPQGKPEAGGSKKTTAAGTPTTTVGFQGARTDEATGRVMLGQRQYDPTTARFTTPDSYAAGLLDLQLGTDSLTGNRYLFAGANPMSFYEDGHGFFKRLKNVAKRAMPALQYVPVVSTAIDVASAATGRNFYEGGRKMSGAERLTMLAGTAVGLIPGGGPAAKIGLKQVVKTTVKQKAERKVAKAAEACLIGNSFLPGTPVLLADGSSIPIEQVQVGDQVLAAEPEYDAAGPEQVLATIASSGPKDLVTVTTGDGQSFTSTGAHLVYLANEGGWVEAADLQIGDQLLQADGDLSTITTLTRRHTADQQVYNLTVNTLHTYYIGIDHNALLVHNQGGCGSAAKAVAKQAFDHWDAGSFPNRTQSLLYHYRKHGAPQGRLLREYIEDSVTFARSADLSKSKLSANEKTGSIGWKISSKGKPGGILRADRRILSFWYR